MLCYVAVRSGIGSFQSHDAEGMCRDISAGAGASRRAHAAETVETENGQDGKRNVTVRTAKRQDREGVGSLVQKVAETLRSRIQANVYPSGSRLPAEPALMQEFAVSRTVVREAVATLRSVGLVEPRQGAGVFVLERTGSDGLSLGQRPEIASVDPGRASSVLEVLELRRVIEIEAAGLAAQRRSPAQEGEIIERYDELHRCFAEGRPSAEADFKFHLAIAEATNNSRFREFMTLLVAGLIPRKTFDAPQGTTSPDVDGQAADQEHAAIIAAILAGDALAAREAMRVHMDESILRYRSLMLRMPR